MFEKNLNLGVLLDFYGEALGARRREALELYFHEDYSLAEIAGVMGITRQGARDLIKKGADELGFFEEKLGLAGKFAAVRRKAEVILGELERLGQEELPGRLVDEIRELAELAAM